MNEQQSFKCPNCGGAINFDSSLQKLVCPYCDTEFELEALEAYDERLSQEENNDFSWDVNNEEQWDDSELENLGTYVCESCGGEIIGDENTAATMCPYCDNPVVFTGQFKGDLRPHLVIPFKLDKEAAKEAFAAHLKDKKLLPKVFKDDNHIDEIKGLYVPFWLFDTDAKADVDYDATKSRFWSKGDYDYEETSHYLVYRSGEVGFHGVPVDGSTKIDNDLMESIEPFDLSEAVDFRTAYLAGYLADRYDCSMEDCIERANERVKRSVEEAFASTVQGYHSVEARRSSVQLENGEASYALLPVWLMHTTYHGESYVFAMNGQTGKFIGDLPEDKAAFRKWFGGITAAVAVAIYAVASLVHYFI